MENEKEFVSVDRVYFDEQEGYFKFIEPSSEDIEKMKKLGGSENYDASEYFFEIFNQMAEANQQNYNNGYIDYDEPNISFYLDQLHMNSYEEGIDFFEGINALYRVLPGNFYFDELNDNIRSGKQAPINDGVSFVATYYEYSVTHGQTPQQFFAKFFELKQQNETKVIARLEQELNGIRETIQPQTQEFVEVAERIDQQVSENGHTRGAR